MDEAEKSQKVSDNLERLEKAIENLKLGPYLKSLANPWKVLWLSFLRGLAVGFGTIVGATILVSLVIYIISRLIVSFGGLPVIGEWLQWVGEQLIKK